MSAWINGTLGVILVLAIGLLRLDLSLLQALNCIFASLFAGLMGLLAVSKGMRTLWLRRHVMFNPLSTWIVFLLIYFGLELLLAPPLRNLVNAAWLILPTILSTGFTILAYGPLQDRIVSRHR